MVGTGSGSGPPGLPPRGRDALVAAVRSAAGAAWPSLRDAVEERLGAPDSDRRAVRRLARDAAAARQSHERAVRAHGAAVARRERVLQASRRAVPVYGTVAVGAAAAVVPVAGGTGTLLTAVAGAAAVRVAVALQRLRRPPAVPPLPSPVQVPPPPPPAGSASFPAVRRLEVARRDLAALVPLVGPGGRAVAEDAWAAAASADTELRWQAARLAAAEAYRGADAAGLAELEAGVVAQERLVHAVADLVGASADPHRGGLLQDVTDRVQGLAAGLREVRRAASG